MVTHVHGAVGVGDESDGYPEAWFLPAAKDIPGGYATKGTWYDFFAGKAAAVRRDMGTRLRNVPVPEQQPASTLWYHDHTLGMTRLNVYAGPAGFYHRPRRSGRHRPRQPHRIAGRAARPGAGRRRSRPARPTTRSRSSCRTARSTRTARCSTRTRESSSTGCRGLTSPTTDLSPIWNPEFFGNTMMVNGNTWPYLDVEQRRYRFRFLNGCQSRFLILDFSEIPGVEVWQIGNEGGFLAAPVELTAARQHACSWAWPSAPT